MEIKELNLWGRCFFLCGPNHLRRENKIRVDFEDKMDQGNYFINLWDTGGRREVFDSSLEGEMGTVDLAHA